MVYKHEQQEKYSIAQINYANANLITAYITADIHDETTITKQATEEMYAAALISGCGDLSRDNFVDQVRKLGAELSVNVSDSRVTIKLQSRTTNFSKLLKLVNLMLVEPTFAKSELKRVFVNTKNDLLESKENSREIAEANIRNCFYGKKDRKFSFSADELLRELPVITVSHFKNIHKDFLAKEWICSISGDKRAVTDFTNLITNLKQDTKLKSTEFLHQPKPVKRQIKLKNIPSKQNIDFSIGVPVPITIHHPDFLPLSLGIAILGNWGGFAGRLMSTVREKEGLTYGIYAKLEGFTNKEEGYVRIMTFFAPQKASEALQSTYREVGTLYDKGVTLDELAKFKKILQTKNTLKQDSTTSLLAQLHAYHCLNFSPEDMQEHIDKINDVTQEEVNDVIKKYLNPKAFSVSGAGPTKVVQKELTTLFKNMQ